MTLFVLLLGNGSKLASQEDERCVNNLSNIPHIEFDQRLVYQEALGGPPFYHPK